MENALGLWKCGDRPGCGERNWRKLASFRIGSFQPPALTDKVDFDRLTFDNDPFNATLDKVPVRKQIRSYRTLTIGVGSRTLAQQPHYSGFDICCRHASDAARLVFSLLHDTV